MNVLIALQACHRLPDLKAAQRETWLRNCPIEHKFFMGRYEVLSTNTDMPKTAPPQMDDEVRLDVSDWKADLSEKVVHIIRWVFERGYDWMFKCDVDTYLRPERLLASRFETGDYIGRPVDRIWRGRRLRYGQGGAGVWMSRRSMEAFLEAEQSHVPFEDAEDIRAGWLLAEKGIELCCDWRYEPYLSVMRGPHPENDIISTHKCIPEQMHILHRRFQPGY